MRKKYLMSFVIIVTFLAGIFFGKAVIAGGSGEPGTDYDPLVARSYVQQEVMQRTSQLQQRIYQLQSQVEKLENTISRLEKRLGEETPEENIPQNNSVKIGLINTRAGANLRTGPGTDYYKVTTLPYETEVKIVAEKGQWYQVEVGDKNGWVHKDLINLQ